MIVHDGHSFYSVPPDIFNVFKFTRTASAFLSKIGLFSPFLFFFILLHHVGTTYVQFAIFFGFFLRWRAYYFLAAIAFLPSKGDWKVPVRLFRSQLLVVLFTFLMGVNVYGWRSSGEILLHYYTWIPTPLLYYYTTLYFPFPGVNHVLIFELDPRHHLSEQHIMEMAAIFGVMWSVAVLAFIYSDFLGIPAFVNPLALTVIMLLFLFNPTKTLRYDARWWALRVMVSSCP